MSIEKTFIHKTDLYTYIIQYTSALDVLINSCKTAKDIDKIVFPYLYLMRHCLELSLKFNLHLFRDYLHLIYNHEDLLKQCEDIDKVTKYHGLKELHTELNKILNMFKTIYNFSDYKQYMDSLQMLINKLDSLGDNNSKGFRYTGDTKHPQYVKPNEFIDMNTIITDYNKSISLLKNIIDEYEPFFEYVNDTFYQEFYE